MSEKSPELPGEVDAVLRWWGPRVRDLLGESLLGARLFGSVPLGGFEPRWSDLDVCTVLAEPVTDAQAVAIGRLHDGMEERFLGRSGGVWRSTQFFEGPYVPAGLAPRPGARARCLFVGTGRREIEIADPVPGFERLMLAHHSGAVIGDPPEFRPPPRRSLMEAQSWLLEHLARPASAHSAVMLAGLLMEAARTVVYFRDARFLAKSHALEREISAGNPLANAFRLILDLRRRGSEAAKRCRSDLERAYAAAAVPLRARLLELLAT